MVGGGGGPGVSGGPTTGVEAVSITNGAKAVPTGVGPVGAGSVGGGGDGSSGSMGDDSIVSIRSVEATAAVPPFRISNPAASADTNMKLLNTNLARIVSPPYPSLKQRPTRSDITPTTP